MLSCSTSPPPRSLFARSFHPNSAFCHRTSAAHNAAMIDHVSIPVRDLRAAGEFYDAILAPIGLCRLVTRDATIGLGKRYPEFWLNSRPHHVPAGNPGTHICLRAPNREAVESYHARALALGARDEGAPADRAAAMTSYFSAFIIDLDGNKIEAVTFPRGQG
jgi:catechol 2,3-dioxygenase-like lactoylglutathione lyase family enzyme